MKKRIMRILSLVLLAALCISLLSSFAMAANVCSSISGNANGKKTFTVITGSRWLFSDKITIKQTKGQLSYDSWTGREKTKNTYGIFYITVKNTSNPNDKYNKTYTMKGGSCTIKLGKNSTYTITVTPASIQELALQHMVSGAINRWKTPASWKISKTKGVSLCS